MVLRGIVAVVALAAAPALLPAQAVNPACLGQAAQDACQKAADMFSLLAPQLGALVAGGNATPGQSGPIGGFGHFSLGFRANGTRADVPDMRDLTVQPGAAVQGTIPTRAQWLALPVLDASLGIFRGVPVGMSFVGGLDLLVSGSWLPTFDGSGVRVDLPSSNVRLGLGARLGILRETIRLPGIDLTLSRTQLPAVDVRATTDQGDTLSVTDASIRSDSWRLVAGKSYRPLALAAGVGQDRYRSSASVAAAIQGAGLAVMRLEPVGLEQRVTRTNVFANVALNAAPLRLVGEIGRAWGGTPATYNEFEGTRADAPRFYGSIGLRVGF